MKERDYNNSKDYINRWVISYADLVTLLLALFLVMYAVNTANLKNTPPNKVSTEVKEIITVKRILRLSFWMTIVLRTLMEIGFTGNL